MKPGTYDLDLYRGDSYAWRFILWQDEAKTIPTDLVDATSSAQIRDKADGAKVVDLNCSIELPNFVDVAITPELYATCPSKGSWDLQITFVNGDVYTPIRGSVVVTADITTAV